MTGSLATPAARGRLLLVLLSCGFLAWSLQRAIGWDELPTPRDPPLHEYVINLPPHPPRNPAAQGNDIWIHDIILDGQPAALGTLPRTGSWEDRGWALIHFDDGQPATLTFRARRVTVSFLTSPSSGVARVENGAGQGWSVDLFHPDRPRTTLALLDLEGGQLVGQGRSDEQRYGRTLLFALPLVLAALLWRPWRSSGACEAWVVAHIGVLHTLVWLTQAVGYNADALGYTEGFEHFVKGVSSFFPPGYSFFLVPWQALFPDATGLAITAAQHIAMVATLVLLSRLAREYLPDDLAIAALLLAGSLGPTLFLPQAILAENIAFFTMVAALWFASRSASNGIVRLDLAAGFFVGWAALARVVPLAAVALPLLLVHYARRGSWLAAARGTARVLLVAVGMVAMAGVWIYLGLLRPVEDTRQEPQFEIANSTGYHMFNRVVREQHLLNRDGPATRELISKVEPPLDAGRGVGVSRRLRESGMSYEEIAHLQGRVAIEALRRYPVRFALYSAHMAWREYWSDPSTHLPHWGAAPAPVASLDNRVRLGLNASSILWRQENDKIFNAIWPMLCWWPLAGLLFLPVLRSPFVVVAMLLVPAGYLYSASSVEFFLERHIVCVIPFALVLVPVPLAGVAALWRRTSWRQSESARPSYERAAIAPANSSSDAVDQNV